MRTEAYIAKLSDVAQQGEAPLDVAKRLNANAYAADTQKDVIVLVYFFPAFDPEPAGFWELLDFRIYVNPDRIVSQTLQDVYNIAELPLKVV